MYTTLIGSSGVEPVLVPKIENTQGSRIYWSDLGKKVNSRQQEFQHLPEQLSEKEKKYKKYVGSKMKVIPKPIQFQQLRVIH